VDPGSQSPEYLLRLTAFARSLLQTYSLDGLLWHIASQVGELFGFEDCVLYLLESQGLVQYAAFGIKSPKPGEIKNRIVLPLDRGIVGAVAATGRSERVADTRADPRYVADEFDGRSELAVPILYGGRVLGVLDSECSRLDGYTAADQATLELVAMLAAPRIASALAERRTDFAEAELQRVASVQRERERSQEAQRLESLGLLAGGIAHDFNNLLTTILGNVALVRRDVAMPHLTEMLDAASTACERARRLTRQLLAFAQGGAPAREVLDLGTVLREVVANRRYEELAVELQLPPEPLLVAIDRAQLRQVAEELLANAAEAQRGAGRLQVVARLQEGQGGRHIEVYWQDFGSGVPETLRHRVFDPYFTTKPGNSGLGLSTAYWILRRHGGALDLAPAASGPGACFVVRLPVAAAGSVAPRSAEVLPARALEILVVDDDAGVRNVVQRMLQGLGHRVRSAGDGLAGVRLLAQAQAEGRRCDVVVLDLTLPGGMDGLATLQAMRQLQAGIPVLVITGYCDSPIYAEAASHGFSAKLEKPFTRDALVAALAAALGANTPT
jgi:signal transduction histidine kinase/CheY-like chemotaxis protein